METNRKVLPFGEKAYRFAFNPIKQDARITILEGAVRSSKTWALMAKIIQLCAYDVTGVRLITGVSKESVYVNVLNDLFEVIGPNAYHYNRSSGELEMLGCWWKVVGANDETSEKYIRGATVGACVGDELTKQPESFFVMLMNRLSPPGARFYGSTNPDSPFHWLKKNWIDNRELKDAGDVRTIHFDLDDNPHLTKNYKDFLKRAYKGVYYKRFVEGLWVVAEGAIYDSFTDDLIFTDETAAPKIQQRHISSRYIGVDVGTTNPQVYVDVWDDGETLWQMKEYYFDSKVEGRQKTDQEYADDLERFIGIPNDAIVIVDPSAASFKAELTQRGIWHTDADNEVLDGIRSTSVMLATKRYRVHERCTHTREGMASYAWNDKKAVNQGIEEPLKVKEHCCDAIRYIIKTMIPAWRLTS